MACVDFAAITTPIGEYHVMFEIHSAGLSHDTHISMTRDELKQFRNNLQKALLDINQELNYDE